MKRVFILIIFILTITSFISAKNYLLIADGASSEELSTMQNVKNYLDQNYGEIQFEEVKYISEVSDNDLFNSDISVFYYVDRALIIRYNDTSIDIVLLAISIIDTLTNDLKIPLYDTTEKISSNNLISKINSLSPYDFSIVNVCWEDDGGKNYFEMSMALRGNMLIKIGSGSGDYCKDDKILIEKYCENDNIMEEEYKCPEGMGCRNGACIDGSEIYGFCVEEIWECDSWRSCINNKQTRTCTEKSNCGTTDKKPSETQNCIIKEVITNPEKDIPKDLIEEYKDEIDDLNIGEADLIEKYKDIYSEIPEVYETKYGDLNLKYFYEENRLEVNGRSVDILLDITLDSDKVYVKTPNGNKEIKILPDEAVSKADKIDNVIHIALKEVEGYAVYSIKGTKKVKLLFIFPVLAEIEQGIDLETGELIYTKKPWWHFLAKGI